MKNRTPTIRELREKTKSKRKDIFYSVADYLSYYPAKLFLYTSITANQITLIWIIGQIVSALFLTSGNYLTMVSALLVFQAFFILDCTDGIVARYRQKFTINGIYLDMLGHYLANTILLISFGIGVAKTSGNVIYIFIGFAAAAAFLLNKAITLNPLWYGNEEQQNRIKSSYGKSQLQNQKKAVYFVFAIFRLEYMFNVMFWGILFGYAEYTLILYAILFFLEFLRKLFSQLKHNQNLDQQR